MTWMLLLLAIFGTYRLSRMLAQEEGPFAIFFTVRERAGQKDWFGRGLHCTLCWSWWIAAAAALYLVLMGKAGWAEFVLLWFGIAGLASGVYQVLR
jgi:hypothetical protein